MSRTINDSSPSDVSLGKDHLLTDDPLYRRQKSEEKPAFRETAFRQEESKLDDGLPLVDPAFMQDSEIKPHSWRDILQEKLFYRVKEEQTILAAFEAMLDGTAQNMVMVTGANGAGKTRLVQQSLRHRATHFLTGKFDLLQRPEPYSAFVAAFTEFTYQIVKRGPEAKEMVSKRIQETIGEESCALLSMIPALEQILGGQKSENKFMTEDTIQRFVFVFRRFMRAVCSLKQPMVLLLDDLHWADPCSLDLLYSIVTDLENNPGLFLIGTCDPTVVTPDSYLSKRLQDMEKIMRMPIIDVHVENFDQHEVNHLLRTALKSERSEDLAALVTGQTQGNAFYIIEFLRWLQEVKMLTFDQETQTWAWDIEEIRISLTTRCVSGFMMNKLSLLPMDCLDTLKVAACFGSNLDPKLIEYVVDRPVDKVLNEALRRGLMVYDSTRSTYSFAHDGMQKVVYNMIPESGRELFHLEVGRRLWRRLKTDELDRYLFAMLSQLNIGKQLITRQNERYSVASLCLSAGKKAARNSTFRMASIYLNLGIFLLDESGWTDEYDLTLAVYNAAAEMEMCTANFEDMDALVEVVLKHAKPGDIVQALSTRLYSLGVSDHASEALDLGIKMLADLGEYFPRNLCIFHMMSEMKSVRRLIGSKSNEQLLRLPLIQDEKKLACLQICNLMYLQAVMTRPKLARFIALKMMKITLQHGMSMLAPVAFGCFGMACCVRLYDLDAAVRFGELSLEALGLFDGKEYYPRVYAAYYACIYSLKRPMYESLEPLMQGYHIGMQTGDFEFAFLNANLYCFVARDSGLPLSHIESTWTSFQESMATLKQDSLLRMSGPCLQSTQHLMGLSTEFFSEKSDIETDQLLKFCIENKFTGSIIAVCMTRMLIHYIFGDYERAHKYAQKTLKDLWMMPVLCDVVNSSFYVALVALARVHEGNGKEVRQARARVRDFLKLVNICARSCPVNFLHMKFLVEAEVAALKDGKKAFEKYTCAVALSNESKNLMIQGIANERTARFFIRARKPQEAEPFFREALDRYVEWGAVAKVEHLQEEVDTLFGR